jgi:hypothetical protein
MYDFLLGGKDHFEADRQAIAGLRALLTSDPAGRTAYIQADLHDPEGILGHPTVRDTLDFTRPVGLMLVAVLHFFPDDQDPAGIVAALLDALPPGSHLVASQTTADFNDPEEAADGVQAVQRAGVPSQTRTAEESAEVAFAGLELVPPGLVVASQWRPEGAGPRPLPSEVAYYGAVGRKAGRDA